MFTESALAVSGPEIVCGAYGFFRSVVEIIAEGRAYLTLQLDGGNQLPLMDHEQIPQFCRPEVAWQGQDGTTLVDLRMRKPVCPHEIKHQGNKAIHVFPACDPGALTYIRFPRLDLLQASRFPIPQKACTAS